MKSQRTESLRCRMDRAAEPLDEAEVLLANNHLHGAVDRLYYACFHMISALLFFEGRSSTKHSGVRSMFDFSQDDVGAWVKDAGQFSAKISSVIEERLEKQQDDTESEE